MDTPIVITDPTVSGELIDDRSITSLKIAVDNVLNEHIAPNSISSIEMLDNAITAVKLAAGSVNTGHINALQITSALIASGAVDTSKVQADAITAYLIAPQTITAAEIANNAITSALIAANAINTAHINAAQITAALIAVGAVTSTAMANNAVNAAVLAAGSINTAHINANQITNALIASGAISTAQLQNNAVNSAIIAANTIVGDNMHNGYITFSPNAAPFNIVGLTTTPQITCPKTNPFSAVNPMAVTANNYVTYVFEITPVLYCTSGFSASPREIITTFNIYSNQGGADIQISNDTFKHTIAALASTNRYRLPPLKFRGVSYVAGEIIKYEVVQSISSTSGLVQSDILGVKDCEFYYINSGVIG